MGQGVYSISNDWERERGGAKTGLEHGRGEGEQPK